MGTHLFAWVGVCGCFSFACTATGNNGSGDGFPIAEFSVFLTVLGFGVIGSSLGLEGTEPSSIFDVTDY